MADVGDWEIGELGGPWLYPVSGFRTANIGTGVTLRLEFQGVGDERPPAIQALLDVDTVLALADHLRAQAKIVMSGPRDGMSRQ